jgi:hypothetical protein
MADTAIARCNRDILQLHIHVVLGCILDVSIVLTNWGPLRGVFATRRTFKELATIDLAGGDLEGDNMALLEKIVSILLLI